MSEPLARVLVRKGQKPGLVVNPEPKLVQVVLAICLLHFCSSKIDSWLPGTQETSEFLSGLYSKVRRSGQFILFYLLSTSYWLEVQGSRGMLDTYKLFQQESDIFFQDSNRIVGTRLSKFLHKNSEEEELSLRSQPKYAWPRFVLLNRNTIWTIWKLCACEYDMGRGLHKKYFVPPIGRESVRPRTRSARQRIMSRITSKQCRR